MKDICHKKLSKLVGEEGTVLINAEYLHDLIEYSIEPDQINKQQIAENLFKSLSVPFKWLIEHTVRAKEMAVRCVHNARQEKDAGKKTWIRQLGWAFHYIADWATPHHSPKSKSNPVPELAGLGALFGGILGGLSKASKKDKGEFFKGISRGSLIGAGVMGTAGAVGLAINHSKFEKECDQRWRALNFDTVSTQFKKVRIKLNSSKPWDEQVNKFKELLNSLRNRCEDLPSDWINICDEGEFIEYMIEIARVMDFASQMVMA
jgi:hypothetical protein